MKNEPIDEIREKVFAKHPFSLSEDEKKILQSENVPFIVNVYRQKLDYLGNRCAVYEYLKKYCDDNDHNTTADSICDPLINEYKRIINSPSLIWELMGFVSLFEMDAITMLVSIFSAQNDVERKMLAKHAYTIVYEARKYGLFKKVSKEMNKFPESLFSKKEYEELWTDIKNELKKMSGLDEEKTIRNSIDAHKSESFELQYATFGFCNWMQAVFDLIILIQIMDRLLEVIDSIFSGCQQGLDTIVDKLKKRVEQCDSLIEQLKYL